MKLKTILTNDIFKISTNMIYYILLNSLVAFKYFTPHLWDWFMQNVVNKITTSINNYLVNIFDLGANFISPFINKIQQYLNFYYNYFRDIYIDKNNFQNKINDVFTTNTNTNIPELWKWLDDFQSYYIDKNNFTNYTDFTQIYNSLVSTPSSAFLVLFLLPLFLYLIYFICKYLSHRR